MSVIRDSKNPPELGVHAIYNPLQHETNKVMPEEMVTLDRSKVQHAPLTDVDSKRATIYQEIARQVKAGKDIDPKLLAPRS